MKELFVPYEIAIALKEKGFDENCLGYYGKLNVFRIADDMCNYGGVNYGFPLIHKNKYILAPLYQQVIEWLMLNHGIKIWWIPVFFNDNRLMIKGVKDYNHDALFYNEWHDTNKLNEGYNEAIIEALKLI